MRLQHRALTPMTGGGVQPKSARRRPPLLALGALGALIAMNSDSIGQQRSSQPGRQATEFQNQDMQFHRS